MLETLDLKKKVARPTYERSFQPLRDKLDDLQRSLREAKIPVAIVFEGWDAAGKGDSIEKLVGRLDPRGFQVHPVYAPSEDESLRPFLWRFWTRIPGRGEIGIFDRSWYFRVLQERVDGSVSKREWQSAFNEINQFERMLTDDGMVIVKLWLHLSKKEQKKRFEAMEKSKFDRWRVTKQDWKAHRRYDDYLEAAEEALERTGTAYAPWTLVEATDKYYRRLRVFKTIIDACESALAAKAENEKPKRAARASVVVPALKEMKTVLDEVDLSQHLEERAYEEDLKKLQVRLRQLQHRCYEKRVPVVVASEGWDAAGKGGAIKRIIGALDPRGYSVIPIAAPKGDEATHHYLWRFWTRIP
jgi:polyphosphate kinase 2 (PPK2 family)